MFFFVNKDTTDFNGNNCGLFILALPSLSVTSTLREITNYCESELRVREKNAEDMEIYPKWINSGCLAVTKWIHLSRARNDCGTKRKITLLLSKRLYAQVPHQRTQIQYFKMFTLFIFTFNDTGAAVA